MDDKLGYWFLYFFGCMDVFSMVCDLWNYFMYVLDGLFQSFYKMYYFNIWMNDIERNVIFMYKGVLYFVIFQIVFDWFFWNIYWIDDYYNWIGVQFVDIEDKIMYKIIMYDGFWFLLVLSLDFIKG